MSATNTIQLIVERAERLLVRHEETLRTNSLLASELKQVRAERDLLKSRADAAKTRLDALIERLPAEYLDSPASTPQPGTTP